MGKKLICFPFINGDLQEYSFRNLDDSERERVYRGEIVEIEVYSGRKEVWKPNAPNPLYKNDYVMALVEHAFSWTFMIHIPIIIYSVAYGLQLNILLFITIFTVNWLIHTVTDNAKANLMKINLIQDQWIHIAQIFVTWTIYVAMRNGIL